MSKKLKYECNSCKHEFTREQMPHGAWERCPACRSTNLTKPKEPGLRWWERGSDGICHSWPQNGAFGKW